MLTCHNPECQNTETLKACLCGSAFYCSVQCKKDDSVAHKPLCDVMASDLTEKCFRLVEKYQGLKFFFHMLEQPQATPCSAPFLLVDTTQKLPTYPIQFEGFLALESNKAGLKPLTWNPFVPAYDCNSRVIKHSMTIFAEISRHRAKDRLVVICQEAKRFAVFVLNLEADHIPYEMLFALQTRKFGAFYETIDPFPAGLLKAVAVCNHPDCQNSETLKACKCGSALYCSYTCQETDWLRHKNFCALMTRGLKEKSFEVLRKHNGISFYIQTLRKKIAFGSPFLLVDVSENFSQKHPKLAPVQYQGECTHKTGSVLNGIPKTSFLDTDAIKLNPKAYNYASHIMHEVKCHRKQLKMVVMSQNATSFALFVLKVKPNL